MPSAITHSVVGLSLAIATSKQKPPIKTVALSMILAMIPDLDVVTFMLGISYGDFWGHRGFVHSIFFAVLLGFLITTVFFKEKRLFSKSYFYLALFFSVVVASHGILDAFTNGGLGIALLSPFDNERYFFWTTPIKVSPLSIKLFLSDRGVSILKNEFMWVWVPSLLLMAIGIGRQTLERHRNK